MHLRIPRIAFEIYAALVFMGVFFVVLPGLLLSLYVPRWMRLGNYLNYVWTRSMLFLYGLPTRLRYEVPLSRTKAYVFCANHSSFLDIPAMVQCQLPMSFIGKNTFEKVPIFGYIYKRMHVTVDRKSMRSRYSVLHRSKEVLSRGTSLVFFPEGGIVSKHPPRLGPFKDGAFRTAIEAQVPIVPTTLLDDWRVYPKYPPTAPYRPCPLRIVYHHPISTQGMTLKDVAVLKARTRVILEQELLRHYSTHMRSSA